MSVRQEGVVGERLDGALKKKEIETERLFALRESKSQWKMAWDRFCRDKLALAGTFILLFIILMALAAPLLSKYLTHYEPQTIELLANLKPPGYKRSDAAAIHWLGTDELGRDVLTRAIYGARVSIGISVTTVAISLTIGTLLGAIAGFYGGFIDSVIMRFVDIMLSIPAIFLLLLIAVVFEPDLRTFSFVIASVAWMGVSRLVRGEFLSIKERDYIEAARVVGASNARIIFRHILPNATTPMIVAATLGIGNIILVETALSYLGMGVKPPTPSWGNMLTKASTYLYKAPHLVVIPGLLIFITVLAVNLMGNGLRDALDPKLKE